MSRREDRHGVEHEPQHKGRSLDPHGAERDAADALLGTPTEINAAEVEHSVWDEPTLAVDLAGTPSADQITYARWLDQNVAATGYGASLLTTALAALLAGPWGVVGALWEELFVSDALGAGLWGPIVFGPVTEEIAKIAITLWVVEKRPYWFKSSWQILVAATAGGLLFAAIENLAYLHVYFPDATGKLAEFRWSVCTALHSGCSFVAGIGLSRIWRRALQSRTPPQLSHGMPFLATAMLGHGLYNLSVTIAELSGWLDLR